jgi:hypothetical protein
MREGRYPAAFCSRKTHKVSYTLRLNIRVSPYGVAGMKRQNIHQVALKGG